MIKILKLFDVESGSTIDAYEKNHVNHEKINCTNCGTGVVYPLIGQECSICGARVIDLTMY